MARLLALLGFLLTLPATAQPNLTGDWSGQIEVTPAQSLTAVFHVSQSEDGYSATFDSPDQGAFGLPLSDVAFDGETFSASLAAASAVFSGQFNEDGSAIEGVWTQGGREMPLTLTPHAAEAASVETDNSKPSEVKPGDYSGNWFGVMEMDGGGEIHLTFHLLRNEEGVYSAVLNAPGQAENMDLGEIEVYGKNVAISIMNQASFTGIVSEDERSMEGTFEQGGNKMDMTLTRR